eukprot:3131820-Pleurochrysis_carterae.AAC.2
MAGCRAKGRRVIPESHPDMIMAFEFMPGVACARWACHIAESEKEGVYPSKNRLCIPACSE